MDRGVFTGTLELQTCWGHVWFPPLAKTFSQEPVSPQGKPKEESPWEQRHRVGTTQLQRASETTCVSGRCPRDGWSKRYESGVYLEKSLQIIRA